MNVDLKGLRGCRSGLLFGTCRFLNSHFFFWLSSAFMLVYMYICLTGDFVFFYGFLSFQIFFL